MTTIGRRCSLDPEPRQVEDAGNELELVGAMDVAVIEIDHAVTVEKECAAVHVSAHVSLASDDVKNANTVPFG